MGNTPSVEAQKKGSRTAQKLSKPRTGNHATAGLLNPNGVSELIRRSSTSTMGRRLSLPHGSTPAPSPRNIGTDATAMEGLLDSLRDSLPRDRSSRSLFQSDPSQGAPPHERSQSVGVVASSHRGRRMSRTNSVHKGLDEDYGQVQLSLTASLSLNAPRSSINYDLSSYEAKRLLNLAEEPSFEEHSIASESHFHVAVSRRQSYTASYQPPSSGTMTPLPRVHSDVSLYTPVRRRSLMTPGVATRPAPAEPVIVPKPQPRHSLPATPSRRGSLESMEIEMPSLPGPKFDPSLICRAHTPCEADYKQTGAFKLGTLRITNGSPARTPARETIDDGVDVETSQLGVGQIDYFEANGRVGEKSNMNPTERSDAIQQPIQPSFVTTSVATANQLTNLTDKQRATGRFLPELKLTTSPMLINGAESKSPELQVTSKHTADEDQLFEDAPIEYFAEVLNVRLDPNAKSCPSRPDSSLEMKKPEEINRSDSGIMASPTSGAPHKSLSKADSGYSSNVSLRSFSSKQNSQKITSYRCSETVSPRVPTFEPTGLQGNSVPISRPATVGPPEMTVRSPSFDRSPPPVPPKKDQFPQRGIVKMPRPRFGLPGDTQSPTKRPEPPSNKIMVDSSLQSSQASPLSPTSPTSPSTMTSTLSISNAPRKQGKLQRFLSGARTPLTVHITHALDRGADVPPVPQAVQAKLHEHAGSLANVPNDHHSELKPIEDSSRFVANSKAQVNQKHDSSSTQDPPPRKSIGQKDQDNAHEHKSNLHIYSLSSTITRAASSVLARNPIKMSMHAKPKPGFQDPAPNPVVYTSTSTNQRLDDIVTWRQNGETTSSTFLSVENEEMRYFRPKSTSSLSNTTMNVTTQRSNRTVESEMHTSTFLELPSATQYLVSKTPPPVSMKTRNMGSLRVPPPLRTQSTPPGISGAPVVSRKSSREGIQSYPPTKYSMESKKSSLSQRSSQENLYAYTPAQIQSLLSSPPTPVMKTKRSSSFQTQSGEYRVPNWDVQPDHGATLSRRPSFDHSRHSSLASEISQRSAPTKRQSRPQYSPHNLPGLKHRSSYDGYSFRTQPSYGQDNGPYQPLPNPNRQVYVADPWSGQPILQQSNQHPQHPPYITRGHHRHHSLDQHGPPVPYRVLHSYNSPAYRGVPIW
ncbi:hypothetical protein F5Y19DRAFT_159221 [Xylariaceae sp. FL1651]|nr:hypothetical protein F5Y19DRAFT_159221 [Xylariaceae sp. FL1651]